MPVQRRNKKIYKIGVFGSDAGGSIVRVTGLARKLGSELGKRKATVITGACPGIPYVAAYEAWKHGSRIWGFSSEANLAAQKKATPGDDNRIYAKLTYVPWNFTFMKAERVTKKYRNVISTATCDAGVIISGRWGSMNEFTNLFDMGKVVGILTGAGGIADEIRSLSKKIHKPGKGIILYDNSPMRLIAKIYRELDRREALRK